MFAHGSTGSGKTYTMTGGATKDRGVVQQTIYDIQERLIEVRDEIKTLNITCTVYQLYKSNLVDLLRPDTELPRALEIV